MLWAGTVLACLGCSDQAPRMLPTLEDVPFERLDGATIMFSREGGGVHPSVRYVVNAATRSVAVFADRTRGVISPDATRIAYAGLTGMDYDVHVANLDGSGARRLTSFLQNEEGPPSWTTDGLRILYPLHSVNAGEPAHIVSDSPEGNDRQVELQFPLVNGGYMCPTVEYLRYDQVSQSPSGHFAFICMRELYVANAAEARMVASVADSTAWWALHSPVWSPDGREIAFIMYSRSSFMVRVLDVGSGGIRTVAQRSMPEPAVNWAHRLCWSPGGGTIVFTAPTLDLESRLFAVSLAEGVTREFTSRPRQADTNISCARQGNASPGPA